MSVKATKSPDGAVVTIQISGRFAFSLYKSFREAQELSETASRYVIDLSQCTYVDSSALGMLGMLKKKVGENVEVEIIKVSPEIRELLDMVKDQLALIVH